MRPSPALRRLRTAASPLALAAALALAAPAWAGPDGGRVTRGEAAIRQEGRETIITQGSRRAVVEWDGFDVGADETVRFEQPDRGSVTLNRVRGATPSDIAGAIEANGAVWVLNRHGVMIRDTARIDVGGLVASSADIPDDAFMAGGNRLTIPGEPGATVSNAGRITAREGGLVGLVAPHAENAGVIEAELGAVVVGGRAGLAVDLAGDGLLAFEIAPEALAGATAASAATTGEIRARGGRVLITAEDAAALVDSAVSVAGLVAAPTLGAATGAVEIAGRDVAVTGRIAAAGAAPGEDGGRIAVRARRASVAEGATLDASGARDGGRVEVVARESAVFGGFASVKGGARGGFVDTSAPDLRVSGFVDASAWPGGVAGEWLIDPVDFVIGPNGTAGVTLTSNAITAALQLGATVTVDTGGPGQGGLATTDGANGAPDDLPGSPFDAVNGAAGDIRVVGGLGAIALGANPATLRFIANRDIVFESGSGGLGQTGAGGALSVEFDAGRAIAMRSDDASAFTPIALRGAVIMAADSAIAVGPVSTSAGLGGGGLRPIRLDAPTIAIDSGVAAFGGAGLGFGRLALDGATASVRAANIDSVAEAALSGVTTLSLIGVGAGDGPLRIGASDAITIGPDSFEVLNLAAPSLSGVTTLTVTAEDRPVAVVQSVDRGDLDLALAADGPALDVTVEEDVALTLAALSADAGRSVGFAEGVDLTLGGDAVLTAAEDIAIGVVDGFSVGGAASLTAGGAISADDGLADGALQAATRVTLTAAAFDDLASLKFGGGFTLLDVTRTGAADLIVGPTGFDVVRLKNSGTAPLVTARVAAPDATVRVRGVDTVDPPADEGVAIGALLVEGEGVVFDVTESVFAGLSVVALSDAATATQRIVVADTLALRVAGDLDLTASGTALNTVTGVVGGDLALDSATALTLSALHVGGAAVVATDGDLAIDRLTLGSGPGADPAPDPVANALTAQADAITASDLVAGDTQLTIADSGGAVALGRFDVAGLGIGVSGLGVAIDEIALDSGVVRGGFGATPGPATLRVDAVRFDATGPTTLTAQTLSTLDRVVAAGDLVAGAAGIRLGRATVGGDLTASAGAGGVLKLTDAAIAAAPSVQTIQAVEIDGAPALSLDAPATAPGTGARTGFDESFAGLLDVTGETTLSAGAGGDILLPGAATGDPASFLDNRFGAALTATGEDIAIEAAGALSLAAVTAGGRLALRANAGDGDADAGGITQSGPITVDGTAAFLTGRGVGGAAAVRADVTLENPDNRFGDGIGTDTVGVLARAAIIRTDAALAVAGAQTAGDLRLSSAAAGPLALRVADAVAGGGVEAVAAAGGLSMDRVRAGGALAGGPNAGEGLFAQAAGAARLADIDARDAGRLRVDAGAEATLEAFLFSSFLVTAGTFATLEDGAGGDGVAEAVSSDVTLRRLGLGALSAQSGGDMLIDGVAAAGPVTLGAAGDVTLGTLRAEATLDALAGGVVATAPEGLRGYGWSLMPAAATTLGFDAATALGDAPALGRVQAQTAAGDPGGGADSFARLVDAGGAARFEARGFALDGTAIALLPETVADPLRNRFGATVALYAPSTAAQTSVRIEAGRAPGDAQGAPLAFGRFPGETRPEAVRIDSGTLSVRNDAAILDADGGVVVLDRGFKGGGGADFVAQDHADPTLFHDVILDASGPGGAAVNRFARAVAIDAEDVFLDAAGIAIDGVDDPGEPGDRPALRLGAVTARLGDSDDAQATAGPGATDLRRGANRVLTIRADSALSQDGPIRIEGDGALAEISAARGAAAFDVTLTDAANDFQRLSLLGRQVGVADVDALALEDSAAADAGAAPGALAVTALGPLTLARVRVGGEDPAAGNSLTATAPAIAGEDIDAGDLSLILTATGAAPSLERFRTRDLRVEGPDALLGLTLTDGQIRGVLSRGGTPATTIGAITVDNVIFGDGVSLIGAPNNPVLEATDSLTLDGLRAGGTLTARAGVGLRLGRVALGALDAEAGSGGILKIADAGLGPLAPVAVARIVNAEPGAASDGRSLETPPLFLPFTAFSQLIDVAGATVLTARDGGDILLPSASLGDPALFVDNRFGDTLAATGKNIAIEAAGALSLGAVSASGELALRANAQNGPAGAGAITQSGPITVAGQAWFLTGRDAAGAVGVRADVTLTDPGNAMPAIALLARDAAISQTGDFTLSDSRLNGDGRFESAGALTARDVAALGDLTLTGGAVKGDRLAAGGGLGAFAGGVVDLDDMRAGSATLVAGLDASIDRFDLDGALTATAGAGAGAGRALRAADGRAGGDVSLTAQDRAALTARDLRVGGDLGTVSTGGQNVARVIVDGSATLRATGGTGDPADDVTLGDLRVGGSLTVEGATAGARASRDLLLSDVSVGGDAALRAAGVIDGDALDAGGAGRIAVVGDLGAEAGAVALAHLQVDRRADLAADGALALGDFAVGALRVRSGLVTPATLALLRGRIAGAERGAAGDPAPLAVAGFPGGSDAALRAEARGGALSLDQVEVGADAAGPRARPAVNGPGEVALAGVTVVGPNQPDGGGVTIGLTIDGGATAPIAGDAGLGRVTAEIAPVESIAIAPLTRAAVAADIAATAAPRALGAARLEGASDVAASRFRVAGALAVDAAGRAVLLRGTAASLTAAAGATSDGDAATGTGAVEGATLVIAGDLTIATPQGGVRLDATRVGGAASIAALGAVGLGTLRVEGALDAAARDAGARGALRSLGDGTAAPPAFLIAGDGGAGSRAVAPAAFDALLSVGGPARFEAGGRAADGIAIGLRSGDGADPLRNRFDGTVALYATQSGGAAPTRTVIETGRAAGAAQGRPLEFGRFPGETRDEAAFIAGGSLSVRNDAAILAPSGQILRALSGPADFVAADWRDAALLHDIDLPDPGNRFGDGTRAQALTLRAQDATLAAAGALAIGAAPDDGDAATPPFETTVTGVLTLARIDGDVLVDHEGPLDLVALSLSGAGAPDLTVTMTGPDGGRDLVFLPSPGQTRFADGRFGAVTVIGAEDVTLPRTTGRAGDSVLFARDLRLRGVTGRVAFDGERVDQRQLETENAFGGVDLTGSLDFTGSPGMRSLDLNGDIGGVNTRAAGLRPRPGVTGREFLFNFCVIGDQASCAATPAAVIQAQVRLDPPTLFDLDLVALTDVYASFGNEELWSLPPGFLAVGEEPAQ